MDSRIAWCQPEQIDGPAHHHWLRLWEITCSGGEEDITSSELCGNEKEDKTPNAVDNPDCMSYNTQQNRNIIRGDGSNKASTYALNHSKNLALLKTNRLLPWMKTGEESWKYNSISTIRRLNEEMKDFYEYMSATPEEQFMREQVLQRVRDVINDLWADATIGIYGSFETGLYLPVRVVYSHSFSDIDVVVFGDWTDLPLHTLELELSQRGIADPENIKVIKTQVPVIKFIDKQTDVKVDISFNQTGGMESLPMIKYYLARYPCLKYLALVLKYFLLQRNLNEADSGGISSYCLLCLIISFLQTYPRPHTLCPDVYLAILLIEFFELYGCNFNYHKIGIRIKDGGGYLSKQDLTTLNHGFVPSFLYIEDPLFPDQDVGRSSYGAFQVKHSFEYAYIVLSQAESLRKPKGESILGRIIRVSEDLIEYRQWIKNNFPVVEISSGLTEYDGDSDSDGTASPRSTPAATADSSSSSSIESDDYASISPPRRYRDNNCSPPSYR